jgi:glutathione synthase/RimK-type ligase-like ATP-grasp enzyme
VRVALLSCRNLPAWEVDDRPFAAALTALGVEVETVAWDADIAWTRFDAAILRTTWDYVGRYEEFLARLDRIAAVTRLFNPAPVSRWNLDKRYLRELERAGVPSPPTAWIAAGEEIDLRRWLAGHGARRGFLKPVVGASASGTLRFSTSPADLARAAAHLARTPAPWGWMLQPYLESVETQGEVSAIVIDGEITHAVRKVPVPGDYRVQDDHGAKDFALEPSTRLVELSRTAVAAARSALHLAEPLLYARVDFLADDNDDLWLTELELVEPSLFFRHGPEAAPRLAEALLQRLARAAPIPPIA